MRGCDSGENSRNVLKGGEQVAESANPHPLPTLNLPDPACVYARPPLPTPDPPPPPIANRFNTVVGSSFAAAISLVVIMTLFPFLTFGGACKSFILNNFATSVGTVAYSGSYFPCWSLSTDVVGCTSALGVVFAFPHLLSLLLRWCRGGDLAAAGV